MPDIEQPTPRRPPITPVQRRLIKTVAVGATVIATIGFAGSYAAVRALATRKGFGLFAYVFPIGVDVGIGALLALDLVLTWLRIPFPLLRPAAWLLTAGTIVFNAASSVGDPLGMGMHALIPVLFIVVTEAARHAVARISAIEAGRDMDPVRLWRWLLAPAPTFRLWRRMKLWELRSYDDTIRLEQNRLMYRTHLRAKHGRAWRYRAPVEALLPLKLSRHGIPLDRAALEHLGVPLPALPAPMADQTAEHTEQPATVDQRAAEVAAIVNPPTLPTPTIPAGRWSKPAGKSLPHGWDQIRTFPTQSTAAVPSRPPRREVITHRVRLDDPEPPVEEPQELHEDCLSDMDEPPATHTDDESTSAQENPGKSVPPDTDFPPDPEQPDTGKAASGKPAGRHRKAATERGGKVASTNAATRRQNAARDFLAKHQADPSLTDRQYAKQIGMDIKTLRKGLAEITPAQPAP